MDTETEKIIERIKVEKDFFEKAKLLDYLKKSKQIPLKKISEWLKLKPSYISHILRLNRLPDLIIDGYYSQMISISHLFIISRLKNHEQMTQLYEQVLGDNFTAQQTEVKVREVLYKIKDGGLRLTEEEVAQFLKQFDKDSSKKIQIVQTRVKGRIIIEIDGNLVKTTSELRKLLKLLTREQDTS